MSEAILKVFTWEEKGGLSPPLKTGSLAYLRGNLLK